MKNTGCFPQCVYSFSSSSTAVALLLCCLLPCTCSRFLLSFACCYHALPPPKNPPSWGSRCAFGDAVSKVRLLHQQGDLFDFSSRRRGYFGGQPGAHRALAYDDTSCPRVAQEERFASAELRSAAAPCFFSPQEQHSLPKSALQSCRSQLPPAAARSSRCLLPSWLAWRWLRPRRRRRGATTSPSRGGRPSSSLETPARCAQCC